MRVIYPATTFDATITYPSLLYPSPQYTTGTAQEQIDGQAFFTSQAALMLPDWSDGAGRPGILACHGRGQTAYQTFVAANNKWGDYTRALCDAGFVILGFDAGKNSWSNNLTLRVFEQAYDYLYALTGNPKVGLMGSSMGTITALQWLRRNQEKVGASWLFSTFMDLDVVRGTAGWVAPYSVKPGDPNDYITYPAPGSPTFVANQASLSGAYKVDTDAEWTAHSIIQGHTPARYPQDWWESRITFQHAIHDEGVPYQATEWFASQLDPAKVRVVLASSTAAKHEPETHLIGKSTDAETLAAGGIPRAWIRDWFMEWL